MRVLFVKQDHASPSGLVGDAFASLGWDVSELTVVPAERYHSPDVSVDFPSAAAFDALVLYGAAWSVYDAATIGGRPGRPGRRPAMRRFSHRRGDHCACSQA